MNNKRGMSTVVTTLLIILLSIIAIGVVWVVVKNILSKGEEDMTLTGITLNLEIQKASIAGNTLYVIVHRNSGEGNLVGINFVIGDGENSVVVRRNTNLPQLGTQTFTFSISNELSTLVGDIKTIAIAPIYETSAGKEKVGEIVDSTDSIGVGVIGGGGDGGDGGNGGDGGVVCGNGVFELGEECDDGNFVNGDGCSSACLDEGLGGLYCGDLTCDVTETSENCPLDCAVPASCDGVWNQTDIDDGNECDGSPLPNGCFASCTCEQGFTENGAGGCNLNSPINTGAIFSVWPSGAVKYFDSEDFPVDVYMYTYYYVNFSDSSENGCFGITWAEYLELNGRSYIRTEFIVNVTSGQTYNIWEAENCGQ